MSLRRPPSPARCHPTRIAFDGALCRECFQLTLGEMRIVRRLVLSSVRGHQFGATVPPACPHCQAQPPAWNADTEGGACFLCGQRFLRRDVDLILAAAPRRS